MPNDFQKVDNQSVEPYSFFKSLIVGLGLMLLWAACIPDQEKISSDSTIRLRFSADTVLFDTLFSSVGSITKRLKVFNPSGSAVRISSISLGMSDQSAYTITVNGREGHRFEQTLLFGQDSLTILVKATIDPQNTNLPFLVNDSIVFITNQNLQDVKLVAWGQDAHFLNDSVLTGTVDWVADKPYVIYNSVLIDSTSTLNIHPGVRVYMNSNSYLFVQGQLRVQGTADEPVLFRNARLDAKYLNAPGQWNGIVMLQGSNQNLIEHAIFRNAVFGFNLNHFDEDDQPDIIFRNVIIENMLSAGIVAVNADVLAENMLINNCGDYLVGNLGGGNYRYIHCTFANYNFDFFREGPSVVFTDQVQLNNGNTVTNPLNIQLQNTIIWGSQRDEVLISITQTTLSINQSHNLIRSTNLNFWSGNQNILNQDPKFSAPPKFEYTLDTLSPAKDKALPGLLLFDIKSRPRNGQPDIGAYERIE